MNFLVLHSTKANSMKGAASARPVVRVTMFLALAVASCGQSVPSTCAGQAPDEFLNWAKTAAIPRLSPPDRGDFRALRQAIGGARVVGLGEAARRSQEIYELRTNLFKFLVEEMGFTGLAMETGFAEAIHVNDYLLGRTGEPENWQDWFTFGFGDEIETQETLRWMRRYNDDPGHARKLHFYGIDVMVPYSDPQTALTEAFSYLDQADPTFGSSATRRNLTALVQKFLGSGASRQNMEKSFRAYAKLPAADREAFTGAIRDLLDRFDASRAEYGKRNEEAFAWARQAAVAARQLDAAYRADMAAARPNQLNAVTGDYIWDVRDASMFENLQWALQREDPRGRLMVFAHNLHMFKGSLPAGSHVERGPRLGMHLDTALGRDYFAIGTAFFQGKPGWQEPLGGAACGTIEGELSRVGDEFILDFRSARSNPALAWLNQPRLMREDVPAVDFTSNPVQAWDALVFIRRITPVNVRN